MKHDEQILLPEFPEFEETTPKMKHDDWTEYLRKIIRELGLVPFRLEKKRFKVHQPDLLICVGPRWYTDAIWIEYVNTTHSFDYDWGKITRQLAKTPEPQQPRKVWMILSPTIYEQFKDMHGKHEQIHVLSVDLFKWWLEQDILACALERLVGEGLAYKSVRSQIGIPQRSRRL